MICPDLWYKRDAAFDTPFECLALIYVVVVVVVMQDTDG